MEEDPLYLDRLIRSYITAIMLGNFEEVWEIVERINTYKDKPEFTGELLSTFGATVIKVISGYLDATDMERIFADWAEISMSIEEDLMFGTNDGD